MMDLVTATQLHSTDAVLVIHEDGTRTCSSFNVFANKSSVAGSRLKVTVNDKETRLELVFNSQGIAEFQGGSTQPPRVWLLMLRDAMSFCNVELSC
jgi:hypothetical protein